MAAIGSFEKRCQEGYIAIIPTETATVLRLNFLDFLCRRRLNFCVAFDVAATRGVSGVAD